MAGNLATIGFAVHDMESLARLAATTVERGDRVDAGHVCWAVGGGAELWAALDRKGRACALEAHFAGEPRVEAVLAAVVEATACRATVRLEAAEQTLVADLVAPGLLGRVDLPASARLALTLFADELETGGDPTPSVLATGMAGRHPVAEALVQGEVRASAWRANEVTGRRFAWARVAALGGEVDVLTARDLPAPGTAARARGRLVGRAHQAEPLPAPARRLGRRRHL